MAIVVAVAVVQTEAAAVVTVVIAPGAGEAGGTGGRVVD